MQIPTAKEGIAGNRRAVAVHDAREPLPYAEEMCWYSIKGHKKAFPRKEGKYR